MSRRTSLREAAQHSIAVALSLAFLAGPAYALPEDPAPPTTLITLSAGAFGTTFYNSSIRDNVIVDIGTTRATTIQDSIFNNLGIVQVNQDAGTASNQANIVQIVVASGAAIADSLLVLEVAHENNIVHSGDVTRTNTISNILDGSAGIVQINQNTGNTNTNVNALVIALGLAKGDVAISMSDAALNKTASGNQYTVEGTLTQTNTISGLTNFTGIAQIAQNNGDGNVAANTMSIGIVVLNK
jgi:hypothetical protein